MEQLNILLKPLINTLLVIVLILLSFALYYLTVTLLKVSKIAQRIEFLTDIKGWMDVLKSFNKWRNKEKTK